MIIGFCGKKLNGKTEAAKYLSEKLNIPVYAFASALKQLVYEMSGLTDKDKESTSLFTGKIINIKPLAKEIIKFRYDSLTLNEIDHIRAIEYYKVGEIYRMLLQYVGTNIFRTRNYSHWTNKFNHDHKYEKDYIVDDVRFKNEYNTISNLEDSRIFKIVRSEIESDDSHASEVELENIIFSDDNIIKNDSPNLEGLYLQLDKIFKLG